MVRRASRPNTSAYLSAREGCTTVMPTASDLGVTDVLSIITNRFGIDGRERGDEFDLLCPDPAHDERKIGSCSVNLLTGLWKCLACGRAGDLISLGVLSTGEDYDT